jgi:hypothetical protein
MEATEDGLEDLDVALLGAVVKDRLAILGHDGNWIMKEVGRALARARRSGLGFLLNKTQSPSHMTFSFMH